MSADNWDVCPKCKSDNPRWSGTPFREDYEVVILDSKFFLRYRGCCEVCGYLVERKIDEELTDIYT